MTFEIDSNKVALIEERDAFAQSSAGAQMLITHFCFTPDTALWTLHSSNLWTQDAWCVYPEAKPGKDFDALLRGGKVRLQSARSGLSRNCSKADIGSVRMIAD